MIQPLGGGNRTEPLRISKDQTDYDSENKLYDIKKRERLSRLNTIGTL